MSPIIGDWYEFDGRKLEVIYFDEDQDEIQVQYFDGTVEDWSLQEWEESIEDNFLKKTDPPEDWAGGEALYDEEEG